MTAEKLQVKFTDMTDNYYNGNLSDFRRVLKALTKIDLLRFATYCATYDLLDIFEIEKQFTH